jgi:Mg/Co/Ni transporter MgtE
MRPAGRIAGVVFSFIFFFSGITAYSGDTGQAASPVEAKTEKPTPTISAPDKYFDPDLESILTVNDRSQYEFLSRLTPAEQQELARMIKKRVDDEAGVVVSIMAVVSGWVPAIISAQFADKMEPATVARISDKVSVKKAIAIAGHLEPEFLARVAVYQDPRKVTAVVEGLEDKQLVEVCRILFERQEYRVVAKFSDDLSPAKLKNVAEKINDPATLIEIARHMQNREKVVETSVSLSDDYLLGFMNLLSSGEDYDLAAAVGSKLDVKRQVSLLNRLDPGKAALLASHYPPETIARIMDNPDPAVPEKQMMEITRILLERKEYAVIAGFSDVLSVDKLKYVAEKINDPAGLIEIARHMKNKGKMVRTAVGLSDDFLLGFMDLVSGGNDYELAAAVGSALDVNRQVNMLNRLEPEKAAILASHYPPETIARIMEKTDDKKLKDIAQRLSPETMGHVSGALNSQSINRLIKLVSREQLLAALPHIDLTRFEKDWPELTPETRGTLQDLGKDYAPLAEAIAKIQGYR